MVICPLSWLRHKITIGTSLPKAANIDITMTLNAPMSDAIQRLTELVAAEMDTEQLRNLVLEINVLLNEVEKQQTRLQGRQSRPQ
jgi:hypothetical protein